MLGIIDHQYSEAEKGSELDVIDNKQINNSVMTHNFFSGLNSEQNLHF